MVEFTDQVDILQKKYNKLFLILEKCQHIVFFTGAGISTAANIPGMISLWFYLKLLPKRITSTVCTFVLPFLCMGGTLSVLHCQLHIKKAVQTWAEQLNVFTHHSHEGQSRKKL
jgi:hypothetical protein